MCKKSRKDEAKSKMTRLIYVIPIFFVLLSGGCLTRTSNPTLPYVKPANSSNPQDTNAAVTSTKIQDLEVELQKIRDTLERLEASSGDKSVRALQDRLSQVERQLGIDTQKNQPAGADGDQKTSATQSSDYNAKAGSGGARKSSADAAALGQSDEVTDVRNMPLTADEKVYRAAYSTFKSGALESAVSHFEDFLKKYPKSQFAPNAIYWIGEARLEQGRFEEAVLLFDRVIKEHPGSKKELSAQFKQGQAFEKMGDTKSAKIIFQKIVKNFPHTVHGRLAAARLKSITASSE
jgi:tol-pal system protein YbgF